LYILSENHRFSSGVLRGPLDSLRLAQGYFVSVHFSNPLKINGRLGDNFQK